MTKTMQIPGGQFTYLFSSEERPDYKPRKGDEYWCKIGKVWGSHVATHNWDDWLGDTEATRYVVKQALHEPVTIERWGWRFTGVPVDVPNGGFEEPRLMVRGTRDGSERYSQHGNGPRDLYFECEGFKSEWIGGN